MENIKHIAAKDLKVGMYVFDLNSAWGPDVNIPRKGFIKRNVTIEMIHKLGIERVTIDVDKGLDVDNNINSLHVSVYNDHHQHNKELQNLGKDTLHISPTEYLAVEKPRAHRIHRQAKKLVTQLLCDVKMGGAVKVDSIEPLANNIMNSIIRNHNALICMGRLRHKDNYLLEHSVNVGVMMGLLARSMSFTEAEQEQVIIGGLIHDIGKTKVSDEILHKPSQLDPSEWDEMKRHIEYGVDVLKNIGSLPKVTRDVVCHHHEHIDGSRYPLGLKKEQISDVGRMSAIVDVYDAITADRDYHDGMPPTMAMKKLIEWSDKHLDRELVYQFIRCMTIYPGGSLVEVDNHLLAIVDEANLMKQDCPVVRIIYDAQQMRPVSERTIDLSEEDVKEKIVRSVDPKDYNLQLSQFI